ncbi:unnamed protein product, partial [Symbiodinium natans]
SVCLDGCPECFIMSDTGKCELDPSAGSSCSHQAAFNPSVMPEDRGDPGTCKELEAAKSASPSKTALLSMSPHVSRGRSLLSRRERPQGIDRKDIQLARRTLQALGQEHPAGHSEHALSTLATSLSRRRRGVSKAEHKKREKEKKDKKKKDKKDKKDKKKKDKKKVKIPGMDFVKDLAGPELVKQAKDAMKDWFFGQVDNVKNSVLNEATSRITNMLENMLGDSAVGKIFLDVLGSFKPGRNVCTAVADLLVSMLDRLLEEYKEDIQAATVDELHIRFRAFAEGELEKLAAQHDELEEHQEALLEVLDDEVHPKLIELLDDAIQELKSPIFATLRDVHRCPKLNMEGMRGTFNGSVPMGKPDAKNFKDLIFDMTFDFLTLARFKLEMSIKDLPKFDAWFDDLEIRLPEMLPDIIDPDPDSRSHGV